MDLSFGQLLVLVIVIGFIVMAMADKFLQARRRDHIHRERVAMIEKGIVPPPETDPAAWESAAGAARAAAWAATGESFHARAAVRRDIEPSYFARAFSILLISVACGLALMLYALGETRGAVAVGGLVFCLGLGFLTLSLLPRRRSITGPPPPDPPAEPR